MSSFIRKGFLIVGAITILTGFSALPQVQGLQEKLAIAREAARENELRPMNTNVVVIIPVDNRYSRKVLRRESH